MREKPRDMPAGKDRKAAGKRVPLPGEIGSRIRMSEVIEERRRRARHLQGIFKPPTEEKPQVTRATYLAKRISNPRDMETLRKLKETLESELEKAKKLGNEPLFRELQERLQRENQVLEYLVDRAKVFLDPQYAESRTRGYATIYIRHAEEFYNFLIQNQGRM